MIAEKYFGVADKGLECIFKSPSKLGPWIDWGMSVILVSCLAMVAFPFWVIGKIYGLHAKSDL